MFVPMHAVDNYTMGGYGLDVCTCTVGNMMAPSDVFDGSQGSATESIDPLCQSLRGLPCFCSRGELRRLTCCRCGTSSSGGGGIVALKKLP